MSHIGKICIRDKSWTDKGLCITPKVEEFPDQTKVEISYSFQVHQESFLYQGFSDPGPHELKGIHNITSSGILTAKATDGSYTAECQIPIEQGMWWYTGEGDSTFVILVFVLKNKNKWYWVEKKSDLKNKLIDICNGCLIKFV